VDEGDEAHKQGADTSSCTTTATTTKSMKTSSSKKKKKSKDSAASQAILDILLEQGKAYEKFNVESNEILLKLMRQQEAETDRTLELEAKRLKLEEERWEHQKKIDYERWEHQKAQELRDTAMKLLEKNIDPRTVGINLDDTFNKK
jgi:hypothetical protein